VGALKTISLTRYSGVLSPVTCQALLYGITADEAHRFGLPCGGTLELLIEPLTGASEIDELVSRVEAGELVTRTVDLLTGCVRLSRSTRSDALQHVPKR
jgi:xanthine dehydrogenase accessory factor